MKRLQFRHHEEVFDTRELALEYFENIVNTGRTECTNFGESLYAEPMVAKYLDENNNIQLILAVGVDGEHTPYHLIDSAEIVKNILANGEAINGEIERATAVEESLSESIANLQEEVSGNVATIVSVDPSNPNVLEEYVLQNAKGDVLGEHIKVYKDSALDHVQLGYKDAILERDPNTGEYPKDENGDYIFHYTEPIDYTEYLYLIYKAENGDLKMVGLNIEEYVTESEFAAGLEVNGHVVSVKIDATSEPFLSVSSEGVKVSGIETAISAAKEEAKEYAEGLVEAEATARENADTILSGEIATAKDECMAYTTTAYNSALTYTDAAKAECDTRMDGLQEYTDEKVAELSGNTENAIGIALADAKGYTDNLRLTQLVVESGSTVAAKYQLDFGDGNPKGAIIEIPKTTALHKIAIGHVDDNVNPVTGDIIWGSGAGPAYVLIVYFADGYYRMEKIAVTDLLSSLIFGDGLQYDEVTGEVDIKIHALEPFLRADGNGLYTSGISEAISESQNAALAAASAYTDAQIAALTQHVDDVDAGLESRIADNEEHILELHTSVETLANTVADMATKISGIETLSAATQLNSEHIEALSGAVVNNYATSADTVNAINEVITLVSANTNSIAELAEAVSANTDAINAVSGLAEENKSAIEELSGVVESHIEEFVALSGVVEQHTSNINEINDRLDIIDNRIAEISGSVIAINEFLTGSGLTQAIYDAVKNMIVGTATEIAVTPDNSDNTITIGFTDDAIFGESGSTI